MPERIVFAHERTKEFLKAAIKEGAFRLQYDPFNPQEIEREVRRNNILGSFYMSNATLEQLGHIYGQNTQRRWILPEAIRQTINRRMRRAWEDSPNLQSQFPWEEIPIGKPREAAEKVQELSFRQDIERRLQEAKNYPDYQRVLDELSESSVSTFLRGGEHLLITVGSLMPRKGIPRNRQSLIEKLHAAEIAARKVVIGTQTKRDKRYPQAAVVIFTKDKEEAMNILKPTE